MSGLKLTLKEMIEMAGRINWFNNRNYHPRFYLPNKIEKQLIDAGINPEQVAEIEPTMDETKGTANAVMYEFIEKHLEG